MMLCECGKPRRGRGERCSRWCGHGPALTQRERNVRYSERHPVVKAHRHVIARMELGATPRWPLVPYLLAGGRP